MSDASKTIKTGDDYIESLRGRDLKIYLFGELVQNYVDHPIIRPSINAVAETYDLAVREEALASADSSLSGLKVNRFYTLLKVLKIWFYKIKCKENWDKTLELVSNDVLEWML